MECPKCRFDNRDGVKFCEECGAKFELKCPACKTSIPLGRKFCGECGYDLSKSAETAPVEESVYHTQIPEKPSDQTVPHRIVAEGERKHVTVLFSDLTGYTALSEKLDPEEVKEITSRIFSEISKIVASYDGFIEKYAGDAVMAIFGVPQAHEDDPIRAIKAAREIHQLVGEISPEIEKKIGQPILMHSGINTGLVVTGEIDMERGTHGVAGDTINLASRLSNLADPGEILVDVDTCRQIEGHFICQYRETSTVKGKADPVEVHQVLSQRDKPLTIRRLSGLRANLVGRDVEMAELSEAVQNLNNGKGRIFTICGAAGTGKSRLVEEFKRQLDLDQIQWIEGHAYAYSQNIPYFPLVDLFNRLLQIEEKDPPEKVREKIESEFGSLVSNEQDVIPYVGNLYSLDYPEVSNISPEHWKSCLQKAILKTLSALAAKAPTIFFLEDLHWADSSFLELLQRACLEFRQPAIVLCAYRPTISLFTGNQISSIGEYYHEIQLQNLSLSVAQNMLASLLKTEAIPQELKNWVNSKAEGNPFYLEELVNSLIEAETLVRDNNHWKIIRSITESDIPASLHGLISGRLDRLEKQTKRILQEASVIGRDFLYEILKRISELEARIDGELGQLERLDLIRTRSLQPDLEYMFKHAITQEIVYSGLLKKQRRDIHEQIALVMEDLFQDRISEFYETLAFHYDRGRSVSKAVDYLVKSGEKSLARYAVEEAHQYFKKAYGILTTKDDMSDKEQIILFDILNSWGYAYYYFGNNNEFVEVFSTHLILAESLKDKAKAGMFYVWLGVALFMGGKSKDGYEYLSRGLEFGEIAGNQKVVGYACTWLTWACAELGLFAEGIAFGERAQKIAESFTSDQYLYFKSLGGLCYINFCKGDPKKIFEGAIQLLEYAEINVNNRSKVLGYWMEGFGYQLIGDMNSSQKSCQKAIEVALDPAYPEFARVTLAMAYFFEGRYQEAEKTFKSGLNFSEKYGMGQISVISQCFLSPIMISKGQMRQGSKQLENARQDMVNNGRKVWYALSQHFLGEINLKIATGPRPSLSTLAKNAGFLAKSIPFAIKNAENHFYKTIKLLEEIGAVGFLGYPYLSLGLLYNSSKRTNQAKQCIVEAIDLFRACEAEEYVKQANKLLDSLG